MSNALKHCEDASAIPAFVACIGDLADIQDNLKTGATDELVQHLPVLASKLAKYVIHCKDPSEVDIEQVEQFIECLQLFDHDRGLMSLRQDLKKWHAKTQRDAVWKSAQLLQTARQDHSSTGEVKV